MKTSVGCVSISSFLIIVFSAVPALASTIHVPADQPTIQAGIEAAGGGDLVLVASGTYVENIDFLGKAIMVRSEAGTEATVIDGNRAGSVVTFFTAETEESAIDGFTIRNGQAQDGGGIYCSGSSPTILNCTISKNFANDDGGGIFCESSSPTIVNCLISENYAGNDGGGARCTSSSPTITHCTFSDNVAADDSGGFYCSHSSSPVMANCILWGDTASKRKEIYDTSGLLVVTYSDVEGGWPGEGNIDADPIFLGGGDFHLTMGSPCIDAGTDAGVYTDVDGDARPLGAGFDIGADEYPECWDSDGDGYGDTACGGYDCDDSDPIVNPSAGEICDNGIDDDCNGYIDSVDPYCVTLHVPGDQQTIQAAIDMAAEGNHILVAAGTYVENIDFLGKEITLQSESGAEMTVIDGNWVGSAVVFYLGETESTVLDGFTIRNGFSYEGGGIYCSLSSPTITNCTISANMADTDGGGIYSYRSSPTITNCVISENFAVTRGSGIICGESTTITNCMVLGNSAGYEGGGISCGDSTAIKYCTISGNYAGDIGGGVICGDSTAITNCVVWGNFAPIRREIHVDYGSPVITYSDVRRGWPGEGNIDANPLFRGEGDFHLTIGSPCIDSGTDAGVYTDIDGDARPLGAGFDMGADEYPECWDGDGDGFGDVACGGQDCDDTASGINPAADEICDLIDHDCSGDPFDKDADGDGYIDADPACMGDDCDDSNPDVHPAAAEICDAIDHDCSGDPFDKVAEGDGYIDADPACMGDDCDDSNPAFHPGAPELCDGKDTDCDGTVPGDEADADGDGWMACAGDCDDGAPQTYPGAEELCDGADNDCDGYIDERDMDMDWYIDEACGGRDCDDTDPQVHPRAPELCD